MNISNSPTVSIIVPVYNAGPFIATSVESILDQTYQDYEIIIVDDGSTDNTRDVLKKYIGKIKYFYQEQQGSASARNLGISKARGELIAFLDGDDYWIDNKKIERQVQAFEKDTSLGIVQTGWSLVDSGGHQIAAIEPWHKSPILNLEAWLRHKCVLTSALMIHREWLKKTGGFDVSLKQSHDVDLILRLALKGCNSAWVEANSVAYRQHNQNSTKDSLTQARSIKKVLNKLFASSELPAHLKSMEPRFRYDTLVWTAWFQYHNGNPTGMVQHLQESLNYTSDLRIESIHVWLDRFVDFSHDFGASLDVDHLTELPEWKNLVARLLNLGESYDLSRSKADIANTLNSSSVSQQVEKYKVFIRDIQAKKYDENSNAAKLQGFPPDLILPSLRGENNDYSFIEAEVDLFVQNQADYSLPVSIILPIKSNLLNFERCLASICSQSYPDHLIQLVLICSPENQIDSILNSYRNNFDIKLVSSDSTHFRAGGDFNQGISVSSHPYIITLDPDILPSSRLVEEYMKVFHVYNDVFLLGTRRFLDCSRLGVDEILKKREFIDDLSEVDFSSKAWKREEDKKVLETNSKLFKNLKKDRYPFRAFYSGNAAYSKETLDKSGLFDEGFEHWGYQDKEFGYRAFNSGSYFMPVHEALAVHQDSQQGRDEHDRAINSKLSQQRFQEKCPVNWYRNHKPEHRYNIPKVSIYIPSYNNGKYIKAAVDSVLNQTFTDLEICICDDGSTDNTLEILETNFANNPRVRWVTQANGGIGKASNTAVRMCRGMYIGQLDSDDLLKPHAVETLINYLENNNIGCVYSSCERVDAEGKYLMDEYSYPKFSREKMMLTSIAHHFRMFRRRDWLRTSGFDENLLNAVDYDMFLKLSEVCTFYHIEEVLYSRRWHGKNTSFVNENKQSTNTHVVLTYSLERMGLVDDWEVYAPNSSEPRKVSYRRKKEVKNLFFFPDYRKSNLYQTLLYSPLPNSYSLYSGDIGDALQAIKDGMENVIFHLHWTNYILAKAENGANAERIKNIFLHKIFEFLAEGGQLFWTVHNAMPHDCKYLEQERHLRQIVSSVCNRIHVHSHSIISEVQENFDLPMEKVLIAPHGHYIGLDINEVSREEARRKFGIKSDDILFCFVGQIRPYKGVEDLLEAFLALLEKQHNCCLLIAGEIKDECLLDSIIQLSTKNNKIKYVNCFIASDELQYYYNAADVIVLPYRKILTSGSLFHSMSFSCPVIAPDLGMIKEVLIDGYNGFLYQPNDQHSLIQSMLKICRLSGNELKVLRKNSFDKIKELKWDDICHTIFS